MAQKVEIAGYLRERIIIQGSLQKSEQFQKLSAERKAPTIKRGRSRAPDHTAQDRDPDLPRVLGGGQLPRQGVRGNVRADNIRED